MAFWNMATVEPKRQFRYKVTFGSNLGSIDSSLSLFAHKVKKPTFKLETKAYQYLNHTFNYPGRVKWEASSIDFVDPGNTENKNLDVATQLMKVITSAGYVIPNGAGNVANFQTISKAGLNAQVGNITIEALNAAGATVETWTMYNAMFTDVDFKELGYESDEFSIITVAVIYDYATLLDVTSTNRDVLPKV